MEDRKVREERARKKERDSDNAVRQKDRGTLIHTDVQTQTRVLFD